MTYSSPKSNVWRIHVGIIGFLAVVKLLIQFAGNRNYRFHRDELLHLSVSDHLDWGFM